MQLHDVTGKVQRARLRIAVRSVRTASCRAGTAQLYLKKKLIRKEKQTSLSGEQDSPGQG